MREHSVQLTPQQVAQYCGVSAQTVSDWLIKGRLNSKSQAQETFIESNDLIDFMDQNHLAIPPDLLTPTNDTPTDHGSNGQELEMSPYALLIETQNDTSIVLEAVLKDIGISAKRLSTPNEAKPLLSHQAPKLITVEIDAGDQEGINFIEALREQSQYDHTKILVTSNQMPSALVKAKSAGADAVITKPFDKDTLKRTVRILLGVM